MHKLLERQLKRYLKVAEVEAFPPEWQRFVQAVDDVYHHTDEDYALLDRSLTLTSQELFESNRKLQHDLEQHRLAQEEQERLQQQLIEAQQRLIEELSTPIIPIMKRVLILPLIGRLDAARAQNVTRSLLAGISRYRAKVVILDLTGVLVIDAEVAAHLSKTIHAARLKGAHTILTGIADDVAETMVELGLAAEWEGSKVQIAPDLQTGLRLALTAPASR
jgi:anti-anti-sigma regulatory factor